ncbi:DUF397 domain-containing protein [Streptoalloteichus tenebrarius]|uniref:DUF397 domain-containing protein n=1 Tax=Streptoalloteichus tenebrarius (strain ATCC 17920 / DSM 40477 / JCM 4838 / CBS 697.72 / NBRC 16177 / NCIMB 11028 / NRRL B-12390 / A12253. 1 / ISP 5477) TaxID=1933 RepID=UPI0020A314C7|nr:DUF397 domain-containing protein [Streptoalloteichus tenebrarius]BFE99298.1 hypothetical protein GCM10020241_09740 [Streptoalloteichus tenebrarius]
MRREVIANPVSPGNALIAHWVKSARSNPSQSCVEVAALVDGVATRDSKNRDGAVLAFERGEWQSFVRTVKQGRLALT